MRLANEKLELNIIFIPNEASANGVQFRKIFAKSRVMRRIASLLLQFALRHYVAVFDSVPHLPFKRHLMLIHDAGNLFAGARRSGIFRSLLFRWQLKRVINIVTVSSSTARLLRLTGFRARVIISPNSLGFSKTFNEPKKNIDFLFVTSGAHHKRDVAAYKAVRAAFPKARVVLAGHNIEQKLGIKLDGKAEFIRNPNNDQLATLFATTRYYITWSRVEGFGMTVLEALAGGCYCLITRIPCFIEQFREFPQVAFLPTKGLDFQCLISTVSELEGKQRVKPLPLLWEEILVRLHLDLLSISEISPHVSARQSDLC